MKKSECPFLKLLANNEFLKATYFPMLPSQKTATILSEYTAVVGLMLYSALHMYYLFENALLALGIGYSISCTIGAVNYIRQNHIDLLKITPKSYLGSRK